jgi:hypothetical protein
MALFKGVFGGHVLVTCPPNTVNNPQGRGVATPLAALLLIRVHVTLARFCSAYAPLCIYGGINVSDKHTVRNQSQINPIYIQNDLLRKLSEVSAILAAEFFGGVTKGFFYTLVRWQ